MELAPAEISSRTFRTSFRGFDPEEVTAYLAEVARKVEELIAQRDRLAGRLGDFADRDLRAEFELVGRDVSAVLEAARMAAEGIRERAGTDAARWRSEALAEAEAERRAARADAEQLRSDAWTTGEELLKTAQVEARRIRETAERDSLTVLGEAEREAHRLTASARRESEDLTRAARMEAERLLAEARTRHDEIIEQAHRQAEASQERARALEQRRQELLAELEALKGTLSRMEGELDERKERLGVTSSAVIEASPPRTARPGGEEPSGWEPGETVRVIQKRRPAVTPDAEEMAAEVARLRAPKETAAEKEAPVVAQTAQPEASPPKPSSPTVASPPEASPPTVVSPPDVLTALFQRLRTQPEPEAAPLPPVAERVVVETPAVEVGIELRDRLLLPITNRALRNLKRQLTESQNLALEELRVTDGSWRPSAPALAEQIGADLLVLTAESFAAGHAAAEEISGTRIPRPPTPARDEAPAMAAVLVEELNVALAGEGQGARAASAALSRVYRAWRADHSERRVRDLAFSAFHHGMRASFDGIRRSLRFVVSGRGCPACRAAAESSTSTPPVHPGCDCILLPG